MAKLFITLFLLFITLFPQGFSYAASQEQEADTDTVSSPSPPPLRFQQLTLEDGLSQNSILCMLQDSHGFLWIGTQDGLNRYDGYQFKIFKHDPADPTSLSHNSILSLFEDSNGILWIGTWGGGLNRYDPRSGNFTRFRHDPNNLLSLGNDIISTILEDSRGRLWVGSMGGGINFLDRSTGQFSHYVNDPGDPSSLSSNYVSVLYEDRQGRIWVGTGGFGTNGNGLNRFDPDKGSFVRYQHDPENLQSLSSDTISSIVEDLSGNLWIGTGGYALLGSGINFFYPESGQATRYQNDPNDPASLSSNDVMSLFLDLEGILWVGTWGGGLDRYSTQNPDKHFIHATSDPYDPESLSSDLVWSITQDRTGLIWVGAVNGGLNKLNPQVQRFRLYRNHPGNLQSLGFNVVGPILENPEGGVWIGTYGAGLEFLDRESGVFSHFPEQNQQEGTLMSLVMGQDDILWIGTLNGLIAFEPQTVTLENFINEPDNPDSLKNNNISAMKMDQSGRLWIGTLAGLDVLDGDDEKFTHIDIPDLGSVTSLLFDQYGMLWMGTWGNGLFRLNPASLTGAQIEYDHFSYNSGDLASLSNNEVWSLFEDSFGTIWIGTGAGLNRYLPEENRFKRYTEKDGLPNNNILCILQDDQLRLWISTNYGLSQFNLIGNHFKNFEAGDGLQSNEFNSGSCARMADGELFFGGVKGMNSFYPDQILDNPIPPEVVFTGFWILNEAVDVDLSGSTPLQLESEQNFIDIEFAGLDYHDPQNNEYAYKLEGFDKNWVNTGNRRFVSYTNLPGGKFIFRVKAANSDGVWDEYGSSLIIQIKPPYWQAWWFWVGAIFILLGVAAGGVTWRIVSERNQKRRLEELVEQRTYELTEANFRLLEEMEQRELVEQRLANKAAEEAVMAERNRLARDLHDAVTQTLFSISLLAEVIPELWQIQPEEGRKRLEEMRQLGRGALAEMRTLLLELRPSALMDAELPDLLRQLTEAITGRARIPVKLYLNGDCCLPPEVKIAFYRIAQESLNNVVKYSKATQVSVNFRMQPESALISIVDNGIGFDPESVSSNHLGLRIMRERAEAIGAKFNIYSEKNEGTQISVSWQLLQPD